MSSYIRVLQDSAALIIFNKTPSNIRYLYTEDLETCIAIMCRGENGVALIHDSGEKITETSIKKVIMQVGKIQSWSTVFNPCADDMQRRSHPEYYAKHYSSIGIFKSHFPRICKIMREIIGDNSMGLYRKPSEKDYFPAPNKLIWVNREGNVEPNDAKLNNDKEETQPSLELRKAITLLNNACVGVDIPFFDCDLQYDGERFTPIPRLIQTLDNIRLLADNDRLSRDKVIYSCYDKYLKARAAEILSKKFRSPEHALHYAVSEGDKDGVQFLVEIVNLNVNSKNESSETCLQIAMRKGHNETITLLKKYGAK